LKQILIYLKENWPESATNKFLDTLYQKLDLLGEFPLIGTASGKVTDVRKLVITKHTVLFYRITEDNIILLDFFDTRQDPESSLY
jgi:plasmid stabilization system protein ParE